MRNTKLLQLEKPHHAQRATLTGQVLATPSLSRLGEQSRMALYGGLTGPGKTERATSHLSTVFDNLYCKLERLYDQKPTQPMRRRTVAISWAETDNLLLEINVSICATRDLSSAKENSGTEHTSSPAAAASSHARHCIRRNKPCD